MQMMLRMLQYVLIFIVNINRRWFDFHLHTYFNAYKFTRTKKMREFKTAETNNLHKLLLLLLWHYIELPIIQISAQKIMKFLFKVVLVIVSIFFYLQFKRSFYYYLNET